MADLENELEEDEVAKNAKYGATDEGLSIDKESDVSTKVLSKKKAHAAVERKVDIDEVSKTQTKKEEALEQSLTTSHPKRKRGTCKTRVPHIRGDSICC